MNEPEPSATIQCSTGPFWAYELERAFDALVEAGFTEVELMVTRDPSTQEPDLPHQLAKQRNLRIGAVHGPFLVVTKNVWGLDPLGKIKRGVEMCKALGASCLIVHPPYLWERDYARWLAVEAEQYESETGVTIAVETMYPKWVAGRRLRAYRWLDPLRLHDACHTVALDTSHLAVARLDILKAYETLRPKLAHIHLSNNNLDGRDGHLELDRGRLPLDRFIAELRRTRYSGTVSLELGVGRYLQDFNGLVSMLRRNREFLQDRLTRRRRLTKGMPRA